jgi:hypothetical protein
MWVGGQRHAPAEFTPGKDPVPILQEAGQAPGPVWVGAENLATTGIRSPDLPARSESLYRLNYPGPRINQVTEVNSVTTYTHAREIIPIILKDFSFLANIKRIQIQTENC